MNDIQIDPAFHSMIPPLSEEERAQLEKNLLSDGCREPLVIWQEKGILLDGHNRHEICTRLKIPYSVVTVSLPSRDEATIWIIDNQRGRRNLTDGWKFELAKAREEILLDIGRTKKIEDGKKARQKQLGVVSKLDITPTHSTRQEMATSLGWGKTKTAEANIVWRDAPEQIKEDIKNGDMSIHEAYSQLKKEHRKQITEQRKNAVIEEAEQYIPEEDIKIIEGDVLDVIDTVADGSIDCLITDPPYLVMDDYEWDKKDISFLNDWIQKVKPKLKAEYTGFIFCDARMQFEFENIIRKHFDIKNRIIWIRKNMSMGRVIKDKFISSYEVIFYFGNKDLNLPEQWGAERFDTFTCAVPQSNFKEGKFHPTQKPLTLVEHLVNVGSFSGDTILDCFAGSGTTGLAVKNAGNRRCVLIEREEEYCKIIKGRLSNA